MWPTKLVGESQLLAATARPLRSSSSRVVEPAARFICSSLRLSCVCALLSTGPSRMARTSGSSASTAGRARKRSIRVRRVPA
ncbi:hypothetical protein D3C84_707730 [compost metagenome]